MRLLLKFSFLAACTVIGLNYTKFQCTALSFKSIAVEMNDELRGNDRPYLKAETIDFTNIGSFLQLRTVNWNHIQI